MILLRYAASIAGSQSPAISRWILGYRMAGLLEKLLQEAKKEKPRDAANYWRCLTINKIWRRVVAQVMANCAPRDLLTSRWNPVSVHKSYQIRAQIAAIAFLPIEAHIAKFDGGSPPPPSADHSRKFAKSNADPRVFTSVSVHLLPCSQRWKN